MLVTGLCSEKPAEEWPPQLGVLFETSVLCWSFEEASFWRGKSVAMAEVISYAKSMALTRFREAGIVQILSKLVARKILWREESCGEKTLVARRPLTYSPVSPGGTFSPYIGALDFFFGREEVGDLLTSCTCGSLLVYIMANA